MDVLQKALNESDLMESLELLEAVRNEQPDKFDLLLVMRGKIDDASTASRSAAFIQFLFKHDMPAFLLALTPVRIMAFSGKDKIAYVRFVNNMLEKRTSGQIRKMELFEKNTDSEDGGLTKFLKHVLEKFPNTDASKVKVSMLINDKHSGKFTEQVQAELNQSYWKDATAQPKDATEFMNELLTQRRTGDHKYIDISAAAMKPVFKIVVQHLEKNFENQKKVTNFSLSQAIQESFYQQKEEISNKIQAHQEFLNLAFEPSVQSGEQIDLKQQVLSQETPFQRSNSVVTVAMRYLGFNTQAARTVFVNPSEEMVESYNILYEALRLAGVLLTPDTELKDVHSKVLAFIHEKRHTWTEKLTVTFGNGIGLLRREVNRTINSKCSAKVKDGDVYYLCVGVKDILSNTGKKYGVVIGDTVRVDGHKGVQTLTENLIPKHIYHLDSKRGGEQSRETSNVVASSSSVRGDKLTRLQANKGKLDEESHQTSSRPVLDEEVQPVDKFKPTTRAQQRRAQGEEDLSSSQFIEHQRQLHRLKQIEMKERLEKGAFILPGELKKADTAPKLEDIVAFKKREDCPRLVGTLKVQLDEKNHCVWVPLGKTMIPFHISTVKNLSYQHEGRSSKLRVNFNVPGKVGKHACRFPEPSTLPTGAAYIQELVFQSTDRDHYETLVSDFKKMLREYNPENTQQTHNKQLVLEAGKRAILDGVLMRPSFSGKKCSCRVELHTNGFRIRSNKEETLDLIFEDIDRVIYMPADENQMFVLHFHLKNSVLLGTKAVYDVQVSAQVGVNFTDLGDKGKKKRRLNEAEEDELFDKQWDQLEEAFDSFVQAIEKRAKDKLKVETCDLDFPISGSFNFNSEILYFTESSIVCVNCNLPFLVIPFDTVEVAAFERAGHVAKSLDLTFIFKDYSKTPVTIGGIPSNLRTRLSRELDTRDTIVLEGRASLKWSVVLRKIAAELDEFINEQGAWMYFAPKNIAEESVKEKKSGTRRVEDESKTGRSSKESESDFEGGSRGGESWDSDPSGSLDTDSDDGEEEEDDSFNSEDEFDSDESLESLEEDSHSLSDQRLNKRK